MFFKKDVLKVCSKFTGEHSCRSVILIKLHCIFFTPNYVPPKQCVKDKYFFYESVEIHTSVIIYEVLCNYYLVLKNKFIKLRKIKNC